MSELKPVILADREAAWPHRLVAAYYSDRHKRDWMDGVYDKVKTVQAFAAHRLASTPAHSSETIEACAKVADEYAKVQLEKFGPNSAHAIACDISKTILKMSQSTNISTDYKIACDCLSKIDTLSQTAKELFELGEMSEYSKGFIQGTLDAADAIRALPTPPEANEMKGNSNE